MLEAAPEGQTEPPAGHQHPGRLLQRRLAALPDPVETGGHIEAGVGKWQGEHVCHPEVAAGRSCPGDLDQRLGGVDPGHHAAAARGDLSGEPGPAGDIQQPGTLADAKLVEDHLVRRAGIGRAGMLLRAYPVSYKM